MYGGRAIDNFDRRVLSTYMNEYMGDFIFDTFQPFHFYHNDDVDYRIPEDGPRDNYIGMYFFDHNINTKVDIMHNFSNNTHFLYSQN